MHFSRAHLLSKKTFVFCLVSITAILFAFFTDHRWEDWYITFKASKNLAEGNGLVYTPGQRVYSYTSPIGTLIPALLSFITRNDEAVIWIFRIINALVLGVASLYILKIADALKLKVFPVILLTGLFATNILIIDFSINGMETAYMMFFIVYIIYVLFTAPEKFALKLGAGLAGIMYTRPDGWLYAGGLMFSMLLFPGNFKRKFLVQQFGYATGLAVLFYLPWLIGTWVYYGSPVPHTITAKAHPIIVNDILVQFVKFPFYLLQHPTTFKSLFMPPYWDFGGWDNWPLGSGVLTFLATIPLILPKINSRIRVLALTGYLLHFYLCFVSGQGACPWYLPNLAVITIFSLALLAEQIQGYFETKNLLIVFKGLVVICIVYSTAMLYLGAQELKAQYKIVEVGNRKELALWLRDTAHDPKQTVFSECLGYIGFYSGMKMYDYPGMSSPEVVAAKKKLQTTDWAKIITELHPDWVVLRPFEAYKIMQSDPSVLTQRYKRVQVFTVKEDIDNEALPYGEGYLMFDAVFYVFKRL